MEYLIASLKHKIIILPLMLFILSSCHKSESDNSDRPQLPKDSTNQLGVYVMGFHESNNDQGIAVVLLSMTPDSAMSVKSICFTYSEKDSEKMRLFSRLFLINISTGDSLMLKYSSLQEYTEEYFKNAESFKQSMTLSNNQLLTSLTGKPFSLASTNNKKDHFQKIMHAFIPAAYAQSAGGALLTNFYGTVVFSIPLAAFALSKPLVFTGALVFGAGVGTAYTIDMLTGNEFGAHSLVPGLPGDVSGLLFGANQYINYNNSLFDPIKKAHDNTYTPADNLPESLTDIFKRLKKAVDKYIRDARATSSFGTLTDVATEIDSKSALVGGTLYDRKNDPLSNYQRGIVYSTSPNMYLKGQEVSVGTGAGHFSIRITGLKPNTTYYYSAYGYFIYNNTARWYATGPLLSFNTTGDLKIGDEAFGGIVFYLDNSKKHGLVVTSLGAGKWDPTYYEFGKPYSPAQVSTSIAFGSGKSNTLNIVNTYGLGSAAYVCMSLGRIGGIEWYLPSLDETILIHRNLTAVNRLIFPSGNYWTSSAYNQYNAYFISFPDGYTNRAAACCSEGVKVLAVKAF